MNQINDSADAQVIKEGDLDSAAKPQDSASEAPSIEAPKAEANFREMLSEEYRDKYPEFKSMDDFVKGYDNLFRRMGNSITLPKEGDDEGWKKIYSRLGRPEDPQKYEVAPPEGLNFDKQFVDKFKDKAYQSGMSNKQAKELFNWYAEEVKSAEYQMEEQIQKSIADLKNRWGSEYEERLQKAQGFAKKLMKDNDGEKIQKFGNDPDFIDFVYNMHATYENEHKIIKTESYAQAAPDYREQARKLMSDEDYKFNLDKQNRVRELFKRVAHLQSQK